MEKRVLPRMEERYKKELKPLKAHATLVVARRRDGRAPRARGRVRAPRRRTASRASRSATCSTRSNAVAARLAALGVKKGDRVVLSAHEPPRLAASRTSASCAPARPPCPSIRRSNRAQLANIVRESERARRPLGREGRERRRRGAERSTLDHARHSTSPRSRDADERDRARAPAVDVDEDDVASLIYTSGTTGKPKGVMLTHANFTSLVAALAPLFPLDTRRSRAQRPAAPPHVRVHVRPAPAVLARRARRLPRRAQRRARLRRRSKQARVTAMVGVPALWQLLERRILAQVDAHGPVAETAFDSAPSSIACSARRLGIDVGRVLFGAGARRARRQHPLPHLRRRRAPEGHRRSSSPASACTLAEGYGLTEAAPVLTVAKPSRSRRPGRSARPIPGVEIKIDTPDEHGVGEVLARGPNVMVGYTDAEATDARCIDDGRLAPHRRSRQARSTAGASSSSAASKDVIVTSTGENVYPDDVERMLGKIAHVEELAIVGIDAAEAAASASRCLAVPEADADDRPRARASSARLERARRSLRDAIAKLPVRQAARGHPPLRRAAAAHRDAQGEAHRSAQGMLERMIAATARHDDGDGAESSPVRVAIAAVQRQEDAARSTATTTHGRRSRLRLARADRAARRARGEVRRASIRRSSRRAARSPTSSASSARARELARSARRVALRDRGPRREEGRHDARPARAVAGAGQEAHRQGAGRLLRRDDALEGHRPRVHPAQPQHDRRREPRAATSTWASCVTRSARTARTSSRSPRRTTSSRRARSSARSSRTSRTSRAIDRKGGLRASERQAGEILDAGQDDAHLPRGHALARRRGPRVQAARSATSRSPTASTSSRSTWAARARRCRRAARSRCKRDIIARIGPPLARHRHAAPHRRACRRPTPRARSRKLARRARRRAPRRRRSSTSSRMTSLDENDAPKEHPLVTLFARARGEVRRRRASTSPSPSTSRSATTRTRSGRCASRRTTCEVKPGKPEGGTADCVLKTSAGDLHAASSARRTRPGPPSSCPARSSRTTSAAA